MDGFKRIFIEGENNFIQHGHRLDNFRDTNNNPMLYNFCINGGTIDMESLDKAKLINEDIYNKFINQNKKGMTGYNGIEHLYEEIDDHDSKHILILTILLQNNIDMNHIVEIGGGYGNCVRLAEGIIKYDKWDILDLPYMQTLQHYYLSNELSDISKVHFNVEYDYSIKKIDLVFATHSLSELSWDIFIKYIETVVCHSKYLYFGYNNNCPSPKLIQLKLKYIKDMGFTITNQYGYIEKTGASVNYVLYKNNLF
jgi:hypothetical protein